MIPRRTAGRAWLVVLGFAIAAAPVAAATYDVGPAAPYEAIGEVPWASLEPGDVVRIHWRAEPYHEKWVICREGSPEAPIVVRGVPGPAGELPVIDGAGALTAPGLNYWSENRGVIKIGGANVPPDTTPRHIVIENLEIRHARPPHTFIDDGGTTQDYAANASAIYVEKGERITIRNCELHDAGNGLFVASSDSLASRDILVERNFIWGNGNPGSIFEHNSYTAAIDITFQGNRYGPLCAGSPPTLPPCGGNNLKDRSAGLVVRANWIEGGNRQLDLVDGEDSTLIRNHPAYGETHVWGNVLIEPAGAGNRQLLHYGGDSGATSDYRKGTLYFYNNTIVSRRTDRTTLMRLSTNDEGCDARNNVVYLESAAGSTLSLLDDAGVLDISHNWLEPGWVTSFGTFTGTLHDDGTSVEGAAPGFVDAGQEEFRLAPGSPCIDAGAGLPAALPPELEPTLEYEKHRSLGPRAVEPPLDIGAFERCSAGSPAAVTGLGWLDRRTLSWSAEAAQATHDVVRGDLGGLRATGGDFTSAATSCVAGVAATSLAVAGDPPPGDGIWYLVRAVHCATLLGTWDAGGAQIGSRDGELAASPDGCGG